ncbi:hypothetical protein CHLNCDRAFT_30642 [Chlorella variabilis]|uniref:Protein kinase domain-containing protein n=1 Tax=Chlorella variabilis TaxID=554065 RepID=E1ZBX6_CHLVA|nr:hypothetical protein CHLNCDRAFT_30642 [Chlorella variabilis]EFN56509.1 hypothetical protein CHLNCDRAFT_30642 [Chlorella variabilis]|eukprot:XP_005848611.1 hypothetical protein CHLNCDRAFT_30642 [Chlorella variabilis]
MLSRMRHPNIVSFMGLCTLPPCILTEYCERGSLYDVLQAAAKRPERAAALTWRLRLKMALDAATGLMYLHRRSPPIIHRDVKSPNLLVDHSWCVKVADFNLSKIMGPQQPSVLSTSGGASNPVWLAPEVLEGGRATAASDTYSFGLVLWELLTWRLPWAGMAPLQIMRLATSGQRPECPERGSLPGPGSEEFGGLEEYCQLIRDCWAQRPEERPLFIDVVPRLRGLLESAAEQ